MSPSLYEIPSPQWIAAIFGAIAGAVITGLIKLVGWLYDKKSLRKTVIRGLYWETDNHLLQPLDPDKDGAPNMVFVSFNDHFFSQNASTIYRLLDSAVLHKLSFYYAKSRLGLYFQQKIERLNIEIEEIGPINGWTPSYKVMAKEKHIQVRDEYRDLLRSTMVPLENIRLQLLSELKRAFQKKQDPSELPFIAVSSQYDVWWKKINRVASIDSSDNQERPLERADGRR